MTRTTFDPVFNIDIMRRVTAAACVVISEPKKASNGVRSPVDIMLAYLDGGVDIIPVEWSRDGTLVGVL